MTKLEERLSEFIDSSGCVSGDCPHNKWADCAEHYKKSIKDFILELPELKELMKSLEFAASEDMWESNQNFDEWFKYKYTKWYQDEIKESLEQWRTFIGIDQAAPGADVTKISCTCPACGKVAQVGKPSEYEPSLAEFHCGHCGVMGSIDPSKYETE